MTDEKAPHHELPYRKAGVAAPKPVTLSANPTVYYIAPRTEEGIEALPDATIHGPFRPIEDKGSETAVTRKHKHEPSDDRDGGKEEER